MLMQLDGSPHDWFGTGERATLQAAIDDATGDVVAAVFREQEDAAGYFEVRRTVLLTKGIAATGGVSGGRVSSGPNCTCQVRARLRSNSRIS